MSAEVTATTAGHQSVALPPPAPGTALVPSELHAIVNKAAPTTPAAPRNKFLIDSLSCRGVGRNRARIGGARKMSAKPHEMRVPGAEGRAAGPSIQGVRTRRSR